MANSSNYRVKLRRRRSGKTDYQARKALVMSGRPRLVTRTSNKNVTAQIIVAKQIGDQVIAAANSRELIKKYGWKAPTGNIPAAYLTGLLCGLKAKAAGIQGAILDIGLFTPTKGAKIFATMNGVIDAGIEIPHGDGKLVKERNKGDHIAEYAKSLSANSEEKSLKFSKYAGKEISPEKLPEHFIKVKADIVESFNGSKIVAEIETQTIQATKEPASPTKESPIMQKEKAKVKPQPKAVTAKVASAEKAPAKAKTPTKEKAVTKEKPAAKAKSSAKAKAVPKVKATKKGEKKA